MVRPAFFFDSVGMIQNSGLPQDCLYDLICTGVGSGRIATGLPASKFIRVQKKTVVCALSSCMNTKQKCFLVTGEYKKTCGVVIPHSL